jgi:ribonucleoside-diphosphate reductase alpha chain
MSTVNTRQLNAVPQAGGGDVATAAAEPASDVKFCAIDNPDCEACQ